MINGYHIFAGRIRRKVCKVKPKTTSLKDSIDHRLLPGINNSIHLLLDSIAFCYLSYVTFLSTVSFSCLFHKIILLYSVLTALKPFLTKLLLYSQIKKLQEITFNSQIGLSDILEICVRDA